MPRVLFQPDTSLKQSFLQIPNNWVSVTIHSDYAVQGIFSRVKFYATLIHLMIMNGLVGPFLFLPCIIIRDRRIRYIEVISSLT